MAEIRDTRQKGKGNHPGWNPSCGGKMRKGEERKRMDGSSINAKMSLNHEKSGSFGTVNSGTREV